MKFKIWDNKNKVWFHPVNCFINHEGKLMQAVPITTGGFEMKGFEENENLIPVFSTGQTDKNGVELFEGDFDKLGYTVTYCDDHKAGLGMDCGWYYQKNNFDKWFNVENGQAEFFEKIGSKYESK